MVEAQPRHDAGTKIFNDDVGQLGELVDDLLGSIALQVDRDTFLAAVQCTEIGAVALAQRWPPADQIALKAFDLDDLGAKVGHQARAVRAGQHGRKIEYPDALQRARPRIARGSCHAQLAALRSRKRGLPIRL
jgi:hypothetical protein